METRVLSVSSQTVAMKAKRLLGNNGIFTQIVRVNPRITPKGCSWGLEIETSAITTAIYHLEKNEIPFGGIL